MKHQEEYRDPDIAKSLADRIRRACAKPVRIMEVCGTHTVSIFRSGIRSLLPEEVTLISGPGCPVCVTAQGEIDAFVELAREPGVIVTTFGDLMRVPGSGSSLQQERADGADVRMVYAASDAVALARQRPDRQVVFLGVGFETTAPTVAAAILMAAQSGLENFSVLCAHKTVPAALAALLSGPAAIDAFLLPGHVSVIIGADAYRPVAENHGVPCAVAGFEPVDILSGVLSLVEQHAAGEARVDNAYTRAVSAGGNLRAMQIMSMVFEPADAVWRGIGNIPGSGLAIRKDFGAYDARRVFGIVPEPAPEPKGCACGEILTGMKSPPECPLFKTACTPMTPVGPCMVSTEGTCAAHFRYGG